MSRVRPVLIATRVSEDERRMIGAAASLGGENVTEFLRQIVVPEAARRLEAAARAIVKNSEGQPLTPAT